MHILFQRYIERRLQALGLPSTREKKEPLKCQEGHLVEVVQDKDIDPDLSMNC